MQKFKKVLSLALVAIMLVSMCIIGSVTVFAGTTEKGTAPMTVVDTIDVKKGDKITFTVSITGDTGDNKYLYAYNMNTYYNDVLGWDADFETAMADPFESETYVPTIATLGAVTNLYPISGDLAFFANGSNINRPERVQEKTMIYTLIFEAVKDGQAKLTTNFLEMYYLTGAEKTEHDLIFSATTEYTVESTEVPTEEPTDAPTEEVTDAPTEEVTDAPTEEVTDAPTEEVTDAPTEEVTDAPTEEPTIMTYDYYVAGDEALTGFSWDAMGLGMELQGDGTYKVILTDVPAGTYGWKVTDGTWDNTFNEDGVAPAGGGNATLSLSETADVTITFDPTTKIALAISDARVVITEHTYTVAGEEGLCGVAWSPTATQNNMTKIGTDLYEITLTDIAQGSYEFKVTEDNGWSNSWGVNGGDQNVVADVIVDEADSADTLYNVTITFNYATKAIEVAVDYAGETPTDPPTEEPTDAPTEEVTDAPTEEVTDAPTEEVTDAPTEEVTDAPTEEVTDAPTEEVTDAPTEEPTIMTYDYYVAGDEALTGFSWDAMGLGMELQGDGTYKVILTDVPAGTYGWKVTDGSWDNTFNEEGPAAMGGGNASLSLSETADVTITFDPTTKIALAISDARVVITEHTYTVAGEEGLCGVAWSPTATQNNMTKIGTDLYEITLTDIAQGSYEFKVTEDNGWSNSWGVNGGDQNVVANVIVDEADPADTLYNVTITFNYATKAIEVAVDYAGEVPTEPETTIYTVTFEDQDGNVIATQMVEEGQNAMMPELPLLREYVYVPAFMATDLENIMGDMTFTFNMEMKSFNVGTLSADVEITGADENGMVLYGEFVTLEYTGLDTFAGWSINGKVVSADMEYSLFVFEDLVIEAIIGETTIDTSIFVSDNVIYDTVSEAGRVYMYFDINAVNIPADAQNIQYGVYRTTTMKSYEDVMAEVQAYVGQGTASSAIMDYTAGDYLNDDGRYVYLLSAPGTVAEDTKVYVSAWIVIDGVLYVSQSVMAEPGKA